MGTGKNKDRRSGDDGLDGEDRLSKEDRRGRQGYMGRQGKEWSKKPMDGLGTLTICAQGQGWAAAV